jgi:hypothetical protein
MGLTHHAGGAHTESSAKEGGESLATQSCGRYMGAGIGKGLTATATSVHIVPFFHPHHLGRAASCDDASPLRPRSPLVNHFCPSDLAVR